METIEMVRCLLNRNTKDSGTVRYVPLEIYEFWRFLMERVHNLIIREPVVSVWALDDQVEGNANGATEPVIEVRFKYMLTSEFGRPVVRYFPEQDFNVIFGYFRNHFPDDSKMEAVQQRRGVFLAEKAIPYTF